MQIQIKQAAKNSETMNPHIAKGPNNVLAIWHSALSIYSEDFKMHKSCDRNV